MSDVLASHVPPLAGPSPSPAPTLRALIDQRRSAGIRFSLRDAVGALAPVCDAIAQRHARGEETFVSASAIVLMGDKSALLERVASSRSQHPTDAASLAPELVASPAGARARTTPQSSVYGLGAIAYEMLTLASVGPGMRPPSEIAPALSPAVDGVLATALLPDPTQRPGDLRALAQALEQLGAAAPQSIRPNESGSFEVDIEMRGSMATPLPMQVVVPGNLASDDPLASIPRRPLGAPRSGAVEELAALKSRLEADPTPRWMVVKDKMDHGPFAAIELLQQIVVNTFKPDDELVDTTTGARSKVKDHREFSRFAHHANLKREEIRDAKLVAVAEKREKTAGAFTGVFGVLAFLGVVTVIGLVVWRIRGKAAEEEAMKAGDESTSIHAEGSVAAKAKPKPKYTSGGGGGGGGGWGGQSYEGAMNSSVSDMDADTLTQAECNGPVGGAIAGDCGLSGTARAKIYVKNGRAVGISVTTDPSQPGVSSCMSGRIAGLSWRNVAGGTGCIRTFKVN